MNLVIVESPTKARTLGRFLGRDFVIEPTMGHVRDLPKSKLGVDIEHDFAPEYVIVAKKGDVVKKIKQDAAEASRVFLATDPDREGEAIAYHVASLLGRLSNGSNSIKPVTSDGKFARVVFHEITESAVKHALENPREIDIDLFHAQQARRVLDRLVGYKFSPLLWKKVRRGLSAGRVQSVAVRLIVEREREIEAFKPEEYWEVWVEVRAEGLEDSRFVVKLIEKDGEKIKIQKKEESDAVVADLEKADYKISSIDKREVSRRPPAPFTTSTMAQAAARSFFWSAKKTMLVAQKLYEEGLITYHRTDSLNLAKEAVFSARSFVERQYGGQFLPERPRFYKTKSRVAQEAHEAIRPTDVAKFSNELEKDAEKLYGLIWKRFMACQMAEAVLDETVIFVVALRLRSGRPERRGINSANTTRTYTLEARGQIVKFEGWRKVYEKMKNGERGVQLPEVEEGEALHLIKVTPEQKFTQPLPRYTEATLIKTLEKLGVGRPSTYAPTISTIQDRQYVEKTEGKFASTALGTAVNDFLVQYFPDVIDYQFTAHMEGNLDDIANGEKKWVPMISEFWEPFSKRLEGVEEKAERVQIEVEKTGEKCPKCGQGEQVIRLGRFGKFLSCSRFPECDWKAPFIQKVGLSCPGCGRGDVIVRKTKRGKRFYGCSAYPKCKWASWRKPSLARVTEGQALGSDNSSPDAVDL